VAPGPHLSRHDVYTQAEVFAAHMAVSLQIDTRLFDARCAGTLCDLILTGVVALKRPSGEGVLRLCTGLCTGNMSKGRACR
jgi:hypothetical protein